MPKFVFFLSLIEVLRGNEKPENKKPTTIDDND